MIAAIDLNGVDADLARRVIATARSIAPCLQSLPNGDDRDTAISILKAVAAAVPTGGNGRVKGQRIGPAGVDYFDIRTAFSDDDRAGLRALCISASSASTPIGSFPRPTTTVQRMWPERYDD